MAVTRVKQVRAGTVLAPISELMGEAVVESIDEDNQTVMVGRGNGAYVFLSHFAYSVIYNGIPRFRFHCRK